MPVSTNAVSVGASAVQIAGPSIAAKYVYVQDGDFDGETAVYVGGSDVTTSNGIKVSKTMQTIFQINADDALFAVRSGGTASLRVVQVI